MVLDKAGNHVYMDRMDGQGYLNIITAEMKARTALMGREPSKIRMNGVTPGSERGISRTFSSACSRIPAAFPSSSTNR